MKVSFVIPVRNDAARLQRCLDSVKRAAAGTPHEIVVMDHGSSDGSEAVARCLGARTLRREQGTVAALRNEGVAQAAAPIIAFVDADHQIAPGWLESALEVLCDSSVGAVGAPYHAPPDGTWVQEAYDGLRRHPVRNEPAEWFGAGNLVVRRDAFEGVGGFDTSLESCEDVDLCFRLRSAGWQLVAVPAMHSIHHGDPPTLGRLFRSELWRGRDNLRVSWRGPWSLRNVVSAAIPVVQLIAIVAIAAALLAGVALTPIVVLALLALVALVGLRAMSLLKHARRAGFLAAIAVAATYDAGRALALVARLGHHRPARK